MSNARKVSKACLAINILFAFIALVCCNLELPLPESCSRSSSHCCKCTEAYGRCLDGDEDPIAKTCGGGPSCSEACQGNFTWKERYREARANETALIRVWHKRNKVPAPAKHWPLPPNQARFAIMFSGEIRYNFVATFFTWTSNVVHSSGGSVHMYFDVWYNPRNPLSGIARDLARSHPSTKAYVEETFEEHDFKLRAEHPWLYQGFVSGEEGHVLKGHYGQKRKMWRAFKLVEASGVLYTLVVRGRPDATILQPLDLRALHLEMSRHRSVRRARGHYIAIPERDPFVTITDILAIGTMESIAAFASPPTAFDQLINEAHVERSLVWRGFARTNAVLTEELVNPRKEYRAVSKQFKRLQALEGANDASNVTSWQLMNPSFRRGNFSALMSTNVALHTLGDGTCFFEESACIPIYRIRFTTTLYTALKPWFSLGAFCLPTSSFFARQVRDFLVAARIGTPIKSNWTASASHTNDLQLGYYCLDVPGLSRALSASMAFACFCLDDRSGRLNCHERRHSDQNRTRPMNNRYGTLAKQALLWDDFRWDLRMY